jgi:hypothetical protein
MTAITDRIMKRVRGKGRGWVFTPKHFIDYGTRGSVDMALSRLAKAGNIRRIGRGLYDYPRQHSQLGNLSPNDAQVADALSVQSGQSLTPSGAAAANVLGFSTQVPAKASYATSGRSRVKKAAGRSITLRHTRSPILDRDAVGANSIVQTLTHLSRDTIDDKAIQRLAAQVDDADMKILIAARPRMPGWMSDIILKISVARNG